MSDSEEVFAFHLKSIGIPYEREYLIPYYEKGARKFLYDFFIEPNLLIEIQGGTWKPNTGHSSGTGIKRDCEKLNYATIHRYKMLSFTTDMVTSGEALQVVETVIKNAPNSLPVKAHSGSFQRLDNQHHWYKERNHKIYKDFLEGQSKAEISYKYGVSEEYVGRCILYWSTKGEQDDFQKWSGQSRGKATQK